MAHEGRSPEDIPEQPCTFGIHPWFITDSNQDQLINNLNNVTRCQNLVAIGEAGFDRLRGGPMQLQRTLFQRQIAISEANKKPVIIHCVKAWDELLKEHKILKPEMLWMIHGYRGNRETAAQLLAKGMYLSFWYDFVLRPESSELLKNLPSDRIFLETDGADVDIRNIYKKVASDLNLEVDELKKVIYDNYIRFFNFTDSKTLV
jgi:TatD DNase family protein